MNIIVQNNQQTEIQKLDIDTIKTVTGTFDAKTLIKMFKTFYFNKIILDVTALEDYQNLDNYQELVSGLTPDKIIFFIPENTNLCTANFLSKLVDIGIYNFTTNIEGVKYLVNHSNSFDEVKHIKDLVKNTVEVNKNYYKPKSLFETSSISPSLQRNVIGFRNLTNQAGATTLIYMIKKELDSVLGSGKTLAIEIEKNDFHAFREKNMISTTKDSVRDIIIKSSDFSIILLDLNSFPDESLCGDTFYLLEPSIIKINKLIRKSKDSLESLQNKKIILNKSLLTKNDIEDFEYESNTKVFYSIPPLNERKKNEEIRKFLVKIGLISSNIIKEDNQNKVFGLFRK